MENEVLLQVFSVIATAISSTGLAAAWFSRRTKKEREEDQKNHVVERNRIVREMEQMSQEAQQSILANLRKELEAAYEDVTKRRAVIEGQDRRIDRQWREIWRLRRQVERLEDLLDQMIDRLRDLGVTDLPEVPRLLESASELLSEDVDPPNGSRV